MSTPLYTPANCVPAFQLRWSLAIFARVALPDASSWLTILQQAVAADGVRLLQYRAESLVWQFLVSTTPNVTPPAIVKSVKGRLQHMLRVSHPRAFQRNFSVTSVGDASRAVVEGYVADQLGHHHMVDSRVQERLARFQLSFPEVDLRVAHLSSHGRYLYNLHLVLVHDQRWCEVHEAHLATTRDMIVRAAHKKQHRLSRAAIMADHIHLTLGPAFDESPQEVALGYLNNLAFAHGMQPRYRFGYYVGTFGEYDMGAIWRNVASSQGSTDAGSVGAGEAAEGNETRDVAE